MEGASAFVPGHVTGFFSVDRDDDPTRAGSRGAGLALSDGVEVTLSWAEETAVSLNGDPIEMEAVERVLESFSVSAAVGADTRLPLGAGFGVSGAMALGTALAANELFALSLSENELVTIAHGAEVQAGSGLGDVVAQARGGAPIRLEPGGPQVNVVDAIPARSRVEYVTFGELPTAEIIGGETDRLAAPAEWAISEVVKQPTLETFMYASRRFARETGLLTENVKEAVDDVAAVDGEATMGMLGDTVVALDTGLSDAGYDARVCEIYPPGASLTG